MKHRFVVWLAFAAFLAWGTACTARTPPASSAEPRPAPASVEPPPEGNAYFAPLPAPGSDQPEHRYGPITLSDDVVPVAYELEIEADPSALEFRGRVVIALRIRQAVTSLRLHAKELTIDSVSLRPGHPGETGFAPVPITLGSDAEHVKAEMIRLDLERPFRPRKATLTLSFTGRYSDRVGFFHQRREGLDYAFTDFEPLDARRAFPCFDEPRFKSRWTISLIIPAGMRGLSNMPLAAREPLSDGRVRLRFERTRPLPSYLVAYAVGPFEFVPVPGTSVPMRIVVPRGQTHRAADAVQVSKPMLDIVQRYIGGPVPFPKLDLISVPQFSGAMENPGLITVAESILLADPGQISISQRRLLAKVAAHEFAHLWFGDLVTPQSWRDLWLNEGLASWLTDKALRAYRPDDRPDLDAVVDRRDAMDADSRLWARPMRQLVLTREDADGIFDALTYKKGQALVTMFEAWVGQDQFRRALRSYLDAYADQSISADDLLYTIAAVSSDDVRLALERFLEIPGFPLVEVKLTCSVPAESDPHNSSPKKSPAAYYSTDKLNLDRPFLSFTQRRYLPMHERKHARDQDRDVLWPVPLCVRYDDGQGGSAQQCHLLTQRIEHIPLDRAYCPHWLAPNAHALGYYRYSMPPNALRALSQAPLDGAEAVELSHNLRDLMRAGTIDAQVALDVADALSTRPERHVHEALIALYSQMMQFLPDADQPRYREHVRTLYQARARQLGFDPEPGESAEQTLLRPTILRAVGRIGRAPWVIEEVRRRADTWLRNGTGIAPGLIEETLHIAASSGDAALFGRMKKALFQSTDQTRLYVLSRALGSFIEPALIERALPLLRERKLDVSVRQRLLMRLLERHDAVAPTLGYLYRYQLVLSTREDDRMLLVWPLFGAALCGPNDLYRVRALSDTAAQSSNVPNEVMMPWIRHSERTANECELFRTTHATELETRF